MEAYIICEYACEPANNFNSVRTDVVWRTIMSPQQNKTFISKQSMVQKRLRNPALKGLGLLVLVFTSFSPWFSQVKCAVWCIHLTEQLHWSSATTIFTNVWHVEAERADRWTPRLFGRPPSLNPLRAVDPVWPRGLYSGTGSLCSRTGCPFITHGRLNHVHNLFISIIISHQPAHGLRGFKNICLERSSRRTAVAGEVYGLYIEWE